MLSIPQYNSLLQYQYKDVERISRRIRIFIKFDFQFIKHFFIKRAVRGIDTFLYLQLLKSKGFYTDIESKAAELKGKNLDDMIKRVDAIISLNARLNEVLDDPIKGYSKRLPEIKQWETIIEETINNLYSTLRILKRQTCKTSSETSSLAIESSKRSLTSLKIATYDRRTT